VRRNRLPPVMERDLGKKRTKRQEKRVLSRPILAVAGKHPLTFSVSLSDDNPFLGVVVANGLVVPFEQKQQVDNPDSSDRHHQDQNQFAG